MADDMMTVRTTLEKNSDADLLAPDDLLLGAVPGGVGGPGAHRRRARRAIAGADQPSQRLP